MISQTNVEMARHMLQVKRGKLKGSVYQSTDEQRVLHVL